MKSFLQSPGQWSICLIFLSVGVAAIACAEDRPAYPYQRSVEAGLGRFSDTVQDFSWMTAAGEQIGETGESYAIAAETLQQLSGRQRVDLFKNMGNLNRQEASRMARETIESAKARAGTLQFTGKWLDRADTTGTVFEALGSAHGGDAVGVTQAVVNDTLSGAAAAKGAGIGFAVGGPPGAVAGALAGAGAYELLGKPIVDEKANAASRFLFESAEKTEAECRRLRADLMLLKNTPYAKDIVDVDRLLYIDQVRRDYGLRVESLPISQQVSEKDKREIHRRAEEMRNRQAEERVRNWPPDKIDAHIASLERLKGTIQNPETRKRIDYELSLLSKRQADLRKGEEKGVEERARNLQPDRIGDRISELERQWKATTDPETRRRIEYEMSLLQKRLEDAKKAGAKPAPVIAKSDKCVCGSDVKHDDSDGDGTPDCIDLCKSDPAKKDPGVCGCGIPDTDRDGDGNLDCKDNCPDDPLKAEPGICGCGTPDTDTDGDGIADCRDTCPGTPRGAAFVDAGGCAPSQLDSDGDGVTDDRDRCPYTLLLAGEQTDASGCSKSQRAKLAADGKGSKGQEKSEKDRQAYETGRKIGETLGKIALGAAGAAAGAGQPSQPPTPRQPLGGKATGKPSSGSKPTTPPKPGGSTAKYPEGAFSGSWSELRGTIKDASSGKSVSCNKITTGGTITMNVRSDGSVEGEFYNDIQSYIYRIRGTVDSSGKLTASAYCFIFKESVCYKEISSCNIKGTLRMDGSRPTGSGTLTCGPNYGTTYCTATWGR